MLKGKLIYKANINGDMTVEEQIEQVRLDSIAGGYTDRNFTECLKYDITRTVCNILGNSVITYDGKGDTFCESLQKNLLKIYFNIHDFGQCYLKIGEDNRIVEVNNSKGNVVIVDPAYEISKITQKRAAHKQLEMYGIITNAQYSIIDERGMFGIFSPQKDTIIKETQKENLYSAFKNLFGIKKGMRKFAITEVPMTYSGVSIPVEELNLLENERNATAKVARIYGIQEDMILSGSTFDNKENAIIQTYTDFKGMIYNYITQIEDELLASFRVMEKYNITFPGVPQMNKPLNTITQ